MYKYSVLEKEQMAIVDILKTRGHLRSAVIKSYHGELYKVWLTTSQVTYRLNKLEKLGIVKGRCLIYQKQKQWYLIK